MKKGIRDRDERTINGLNRFGFLEEASRIKSRESKASPSPIACKSGGTVLDVGRQRELEKRERKKKKLLNPIWISGPLNGGLISSKDISRSSFEKEPNRFDDGGGIYSYDTRGGKGKAEQEEGLFQQYILRRIARVCRLIDSSCLPDIQAKPTSTPYCCTYRSAPSSSRVFSESRIDGRTAYQRETRALLGIVEIFHRIGRRTRCTVARFIYTFSLCTWSFWKYWYFKMYLKDVIFIRNYSWFLTKYFFNFDNKNNNCYIIEITNREKNFPYNIPFHVCTLYVFF